MADIFTRGAVPVHGVRRAYALTAAGTIVLPAGVAVTAIFVRNKTANAVTGGIKIGTAAGGTDVVAAGAVGANAVASLAPLIAAINASGERTLYLDAVTSWNSASLDVVVQYTHLL